MDMSSWLCALWMLRDLSSLMISPFLKSSDERLEFVSYDWISGTVMLFANMVHWGAKNLLKRFAFSLKSEIDLFLCSNGGNILVMFDQDYPKEDINLSLYSIFIRIQQN